ncbi:hypothetical protein SAMN04515618_101710 [Collimonas sp. OK307]|uniref:hypothetical protein n=1 Tax=Collimonas sp. OK307 TaxID=1801620 RepID=UPI0008E5541A|nr:hypothetical protein [Collimonas sp. OK307]SFH67999.1 hypothetical protein SAMN04515618_101710 [Collimonas sp. OK307]
MKTLAKIAVAAVFATSAVFSASSAFAAEAKNWTPPEYKIYAQTLSDQIMAKHPELLSVTFHGVPPGMSKVYTMFAGSYPERIGNPDDPDDVMVVETGITILDPRWHRTKDVKPKYVMMVPLRDAQGENCGMLVLAYKNPANSGKKDIDFFKSSTALRDNLQKQIPSYEALYKQAR